MKRHLGVFYQPLVLLLVVGALWGANWALEETINAYHLRVVINCGIAFILALSLNLVNGVAGQFSLGHAGFMGVGAYVSAALTTLLPGSIFAQSGFGVEASVVIGGICAAVAGYLVGLPSLRLKGDYLAIVTLGFGEIIRIIFLNIEAVGGARGLPGIPRAANFFGSTFGYSSLSSYSIGSLSRPPDALFCRSERTRLPRSRWESTWLTTKSWPS